jgi:hypothetical protein
MKLSLISALAVLATGGVLAAIAPDGSRAVSPCASATCATHVSTQQTARLIAHGRGYYAVSMAAVSTSR